MVSDFCNDLPEVGYAPNEPTMKQFYNILI